MRLTGMQLAEVVCIAIALLNCKLTDFPTLSYYFLYTSCLPNHTNGEVSKRNPKIGVCVTMDSKLYARGGQPVRDQKPHFLLCYCKEPHQHTWTH